MKYLVFCLLISVAFADFESDERYGFDSIEEFDHDDAVFANTYSASGPSFRSGAHRFFYSAPSFDKESLESVYDRDDDDDDHHRVVYTAPATQQYHTYSAPAVKTYSYSAPAVQTYSAPVQTYSHSFAASPVTTYSAQPIAQQKSFSYAVAPTVYRAASFTPSFYSGSYVKPVTRTYTPTFYSSGFRTFDHDDLDDFYGYDD